MRHELPRSNAHDLIEELFLSHTSSLIRNTKNKGTLVFHILFYLKRIKDIDSKTIYVQQHTHNICDSAYLCSWNLLPFLLKCNTKFLEKYKGIFIFGSVYIIKSNTHFLAQIFKFAGTTRVLVLLEEYDLTCK